MSHISQGFIILNSRFAGVWIVYHGPKPQGGFVTLYLRLSTVTPRMFPESRRTISMAVCTSSWFTKSKRRNKGALKYSSRKVKWPGTPYTFGLPARTRGHAQKRSSKFVRNITLNTTKHVTLATTGYRVIPGYPRTNNPPTPCNPTSNPMLFPACEL